MKETFDTYHLADVLTLPAEEVARIFMENEASNPFSAIKRGTYECYEYEQTLTRLTELIRRARMDGFRERTSGTMDGTLERLAIRCALGNNGGNWATHYTEGQKEHWRQFVRDLANTRSYTG